MPGDQSKQNITVHRRWRGTNWSKFATKRIQQHYVQASLEQYLHYWKHCWITKRYWITESTAGITFLRGFEKPNFNFKWYNSTVQGYHYVPDFCRWLLWRYETVAKGLRIRARFLRASEVCQRLFAGVITARVVLVPTRLFFCRNYDLIGWSLEVLFASLERQVSL